MGEYDIGYVIPRDLPLDEAKHAGALRLRGVLTAAGPGDRVYFKVGDRFIWSRVIERIAPGTEFEPRRSPRPSNWLVLKPRGRREDIRWRDLPGAPAKWQQGLRYLTKEANAFRSASTSATGSGTGKTTRGSKSRVQLWIYKNNASGRSYQRGVGDWDEFFVEPGDGTWGGTDTMGKPNHHLLARMSSGDLVLCWQSDRRRAVGVCRFEGLIRIGPESERIKLTPLTRFATPVPLLEMRDAIPALRKVAAFKPGFPKTLYETTPSEARVILRACGYRHSGGVQNLVGDEGSDPADEVAVATAAGFGDLETNRKVERAAVSTVTSDYERRGWHVQSVEQDRCGYDLVCRNASNEEHVEVKGVAGTFVQFMLTEGERKKAENDPAFVLAVVTDAMSMPRVHWWRGQGLLKSFELTPVSWKVAALPRV